MIDDKSLPKLYEKIGNIELKIIFIINNIIY